MTNTKLLIYAYFEKDYSHIVNLKFFLKEGIKTDVDHMFVINGHQCSIQFPKTDNIKVLSRDNDDYDFGAYDYIINNCDNIDQYEYIFMANSTVRGPFLPPYCRNMCWTKPFIDLLKGDVKLVGTTINYHPEHSEQSISLYRAKGYEPPYPHVQSQFLALTKECYLYLKAKSFFNQDAQADKNEFIGLREIYISQLVLKNGWNISCLIPEYQNIDYKTNVTDMNPNKHNGDPIYPNALLGRTIHPYEVIFIKTNRWISPNEIETLTRHKFTTNTV
jgi:hypothetical protein